MSGERSRVSPSRVPRAGFVAKVVSLGALSFVTFITTTIVYIACAVENPKQWRNSSGNECLPMKIEIERETVGNDVVRSRVSRGTPRTYVDTYLGVPSQERLRDGPSITFFHDTRGSEHP